MAKLKKVNYEIVGAGDPAWKVLKEAMQWHDDLIGADIGLAWRRITKPDVDGHLVLGKLQKVTALQREYIPYDFIIVLDRASWMAFDEKKRLALMDHELCHARPTLDVDTLDQAEDEHGRKVWRIRRHDVEEFSEIVERHGVWKRDLEQFAQAIRRGPQTATLFEGKPEK